MKVDHKTVDAVRSGLEVIGEIPQCNRKTKDGRTYPAKRSSVFATDKAQAQRAFDALAKTPDIDLPGKNIPVKRLERIAREQQTKAAITENGEETIFVKGDAEIRLGDFREVLSDITPARVGMRHFR